MYEHFYSLNEQPFNLTPDPEFLFINQNFREALDQITDAVNRREAVTVLTGDVGTGKTTLCWALLVRMKKDVRTALILNPLLNTEDLLRTIIQDFKVKPSSRRAPWRMQISDEMDELEESSRLHELTREQLVEELTHFLLQGAETDLRNVLVIDEAQNLSADCLEQLRILSDMETSKGKLLQIILSGQLELDLKLNLPQLYQLKQRIRLTCTLQPLSKSDMTQYIYHRIWKAGGSRNLTFSEVALDAIYKYSRGYPRVINVICDRALLAGYNNRAWNITFKMVRSALIEFESYVPLGMSAGIISWFPFYLPVRAVLTAAIGLLILAGLVYFVRSGSFFTRPVDRRQTTESVPAEGKSIPAEGKPVHADISRPLTQPKNHWPKPQAIPINSPSGSRAFMLQVHSLDTQERSDRACADLRQKGYQVYQRIVTNSDNSRWHVVYVGPYADAAAAREAAATLLQREGWRTILRSYIIGRN